MISPDLRSHIAWLEQRGELVRIKEPVSTRFDVARHEEEHDGRKAVLFESVSGYDMPIVANIFNSRRNVAHVLGTRPDQALSHRIIQAARNGLPTRIVETSPVKEVRDVGADVDIVHKSPDQMHIEKDDGHYISSGVMAHRSPGAD